MSTIAAATCAQVTRGLLDPLAVGRLLWPDVQFYDRQQEIVYSVRDNPVTVVPAGHMLGKDFVSGFIALGAMLCPSAFLLSDGEQPPATDTVRVITTSVKDDHLKVMWGEIGRFYRTAAYPLGCEAGGPLLWNDKLVRLIDEAPGYYSYLRGMVSEKGEGLTGHHAGYTLLVVDEASGADEQVYDRSISWAKRVLIIGNTYPCNNFFKRLVKQGTRYVRGATYSQVIRVRGEDSPNVQLAKRQIAEGRQPTGEEVVPGVLSYGKYVQLRETLSEVEQQIKLDAQFPEDEGVLLYPPEWLDLAAQAAALLPATRTGRAMGVDTAQGGDNTAFAVVDHAGLLALRSGKTPDTSVITGDTIALMHEWHVPPERVFFDRGGGGKEHADRLRAQGYPVQTIAFGEAATPPRRHGLTTLQQAVLRDEERYAYVNRRAEMYGTLRNLLDPKANARSFALPAQLLDRRRHDGRASLRDQLQAIPLTYDNEGRLRLLPKNKQPRIDGRESTTQCLVDLIGCSPDEADALVLAVFGLTRRTARPKAGAA